MKRNPILIFGMLCMLVLGACGGDEKISAGNCNVDTAAIIKDFLLKSHFVDSSAIDQVSFESTSEKSFFVPGGPIVAAARAWMKGTGERVPATEAFEQVNGYVTGATQGELRSFIIDKEVFEDYIANGAGIEQFKICLAYGRDLAAAGRPMLPGVRTLVVIGVNAAGEFVTVRDPVTGVASVYDQIAPCPYDCPETTPAGGPYEDIHCDYIRLAGKCKK